MFFFGGSSQRSRFLMKNSQCLLVFQHRRTLDIGLCIALTIVFVQFFYKQKPYAIIKTLKILQLSENQVSGLYKPPQQLQCLLAWIIQVSGSLPKG